jgi:hypothetical protein
MDDYTPFGRDKLLTKAEAIQAQNYRKTLLKYLLEPDRTCGQCDSQTRGCCHNPHGVAKRTACPEWMPKTNGGGK